jgi:hypothetical protein
MRKVQWAGQVWDMLVGGVVVRTRADIRIRREGLNLLETWKLEDLVYLIYLRR